ncbi:MAG: DNA mismatch repair protein MutL, partial [Desulfobacterales bacterium]
TVIVTAVPVLLAGGPIEPTVREMLATLANKEGGEMPDMLDDCLKIMACHGAIRARQALDAREIRRLLAQLDDCRNPSHCPHGRPTWIEWPLKDIEKAFGRSTPPRTTYPT